MRRLPFASFSLSTAFPPNTLCALLLSTLLGAAGCEEEEPVDDAGNVAQDSGITMSPPAVDSGVALVDSGTPCDPLQPIKGVLSRDTFWSSGVCVFGGDVTVAPGVTLTIGAGVVVKSGVSGSNNFLFPLIVSGSLNVTGTAASPVVFTHVGDDGHGGDTNADQGQTPPFRWGGIQFKGGSTGNLDYVEVHYATDAIFVDGALVNLSNLKTRQNNQAISAGPMDVVKVTHLDPQNSGVNGMVRRMGMITKDTTWDQAEVTHVFGGDITVAESAKLTIGAGVVVKSGVSGSSNFLFPLIVSGSLNVTGTAASPVVFTHVGDDGHGGDTNADQGQTPPFRWGGIQFKGGSTGNLDYVEVHYATDAIFVDGALVNLSNLKTRQNNQAISAGPMDVVKVTHLDPQNSGVNGMVRRMGMITKDTTWDQAEVTHVFGGDITVAESAKLTIGAGVVVKSGVSGSSNFLFPLIVSGSLNVTGTAASPVVFTHVGDDSHGGDTNADEGKSLPYLWGGIQFKTGSKGSLEHAELYYALDGILADKSSPTAKFVKLRKNRTALHATGMTAAPTLSSSTVEGNTAGAVAEGGAFVTATGNWWGAPGGPGGTGPGTGDTVTTGVTFMPFLTTAP